MENQGIKIDPVESRSKARRIKLYKECRVTFLKKDGSVRKMHARMDSGLPTKGGTSTLNPELYTTVWDVDSEGYRAINNDTIIEFEVLE